MSARMSDSARLKREHTPRGRENTVKTSAAERAAHALSSAGTLTPGQSVTYSFDFLSTLNTATFDIYATGNVLNGTPNTTSNTATGSPNSPTSR